MDKYIVVVYIVEYYPVNKVATSYWYMQQYRWNIKILHTTGFHLHKVQRTFFGDDDFVNLGGNNISVYICKNLPSCTLKTSTLYVSYSSIENKIIT